MIRIAVAAALAAYVVYGIVPAFTGPNEAVERPRGVKSDRIPIQPLGTNCADTAWPYYRDNCVRGRQPADQTPSAREVRIVATDRTPPVDASSFAD